MQVNGFSKKRKVVISTKEKTTYSYIILVLILQLLLHHFFSHASIAILHDVQALGWSCQALAM